MKKKLRNFHAERSTNWTPEVGDCVLVKRTSGLDLGLLQGTGQNSIQYHPPRCWSAFLFHLKGYRETPYRVTYIQQDVKTRYGSDNNWKDKMAPYPPDYLNQGYQLTISEIQDVLERNGNRHPLNL